MLWQRSGGGGRWACVAALLLGVLLAGCGAAPPDAPLSVVATTAEHRLVRHAFGETEVPLEPQRILALGEEGLLADLLDGGVRPVAASVNIPDQVPLLSPEELAGITLFPSAGEVSLETLSAFQPDLIIGSSFFVEQVGYQRLAQIAPTVAIGGGDPLTSYVETLSVLGRGDEAAQAVEALRDEIGAAGEQIDASRRSVSAVTVYPGASVAVWVDGPLPIPLMLRELGVALRPDATSAELQVRNGRAFISLEQLPLLDGESILVLQSSAVEGEAQATADVQGNPLWQQLPAVQAGRVATLDRNGYPGLRGQRALLADLTELLRAP
jgi:iron complex transport system substrate-binding protein